MRLTRSNRERLTDALLSLVLMNFCASAGGTVIGDRLKVTKLLFLASHDLFAKQTKAFSFSFYRYHHGPFTTELYETWGELNWMGFLEIQPGPTGKIVLTEAGVKTAERYQQRLKELGNQRVLQVFQQVSDTYGQLSTDELLREVYSMEVIPLGWQHQVRISDTPMGAYFTCVLEKEEARESVAIDDATANEFFNELPRAKRPGSISDDTYRDIYNSVTRGVRAEKAGLPGRIVSLDEIRRKAQQ